MNLKKSQSVIDFAIAFIAIAGLVVGIVRIWIWFNANYAKSQQAYQQSRLVAAGRQRPYETTLAPVPTGYQPLDLTEDWVFRSRPSGTISGVPVETPSEGEEGQTPCDEPCNVSCSEQPNNPCCVSCACNRRTQPIIDAYEQQVRSICGPDMNCDACKYNCPQTCPYGGECYTDCAGGECNSPEGCGQACNLRKTAHHMRDDAEKCDDPWELCSDWGRTARELRKAAKELDKSAKDLENSAKKMVERSEQIRECCNLPTVDEQNQCFDELQLKACEESCSSQAQIDVYIPCRSKCKKSGNEIIDDANEALCQALTDLSSSACYTECTSTDSLPCNQRTGEIISRINTAIADLDTAREPLQTLLTEINTVVPDCNSKAAAKCLYADGTCREGCYSCSNGNSGICYQMDYNCYDQERNNCCKKGCCQNSTNGWGRNCDYPAGNCDCDGKEYSVKCGLTRLAADLDKGIENIDIVKSQLNTAIATLPNCCSLESSQAQDNCISDTVSQAQPPDCIYGGGCTYGSNC